MKKFIVFVLKYHSHRRTTVINSKNVRHSVAELFVLVTMVLMSGCVTDKSNLVHRNPIVRIVTPRGTGSGFIANSNGYIVSCAHVVAPRDDVGSPDKARISVTVDPDTSTEKSYPAVVVGQDREVDLALIKVNPTWTHVPSMSLGKMQDIRTGDHVTAKGYPGGGPYSETTGKVTRTWSATECNIPSGRINSDVKSAPGASGGPLVSDDGIVLGVVVSGLDIVKYKEKTERPQEMRRVIADSDEEFAKTVAEVTESLKGSLSPEQIAQLNRIQGETEERVKNVRSAIERWSELEHDTLCAIPVDSVRVMLTKWRIPFDGK